jgi:SAM-dependent methyltransferase
MKSLSKNLLVLILFPVLILRRIYFWNRVDKSKLPGAQFAEFGFDLGIKLLYKFKLSPRLLLNPVSIVRYFEFDFVNSSLDFQNRNKILDVSSPYLFGFYASSKYQLEYNYVNPDERDLANVNSLSAKMNFKGKYFPKPMDALNLSFPDNYFDKIISISVIEHIKDEGDSNAVKEIWRTLKTGGLFSFTVPVTKNFEIEYRNRDEYNLDKNDKANKYFFQRIYDKQKIEERLLTSISNYEIIQQKIFGAKEKEFYSEYKERWIKFNYWETVKDPYYIANKFSNFNDIDDLEDIGVIGITIRKLK